MPSRIPLIVSAALFTLNWSGGARADLVCKRLDPEGTAKIIVETEVIGLRAVCYTLQGRKGQSMTVRVVDGPGMTLAVSYQKPGATIDTTLADGVNRFEFAAEDTEYEFDFAKLDSEIGVKHSLTFSVVVK